MEPTLPYPTTTRPEPAGSGGDEATAVVVGATRPVVGHERTPVHIVVGADTLRPRRRGSGDVGVEDEFVRVEYTQFGCHHGVVVR